MKLLKSMFAKTADNTISPDDVKNIKTLLSLLNAIVDFLYSRNELQDDLYSKFKTNQQCILRILNINGLGVYFTRHITAKEIDSLKTIIQLSEEIVKIGNQKSYFLSGKTHITQLHHLIKDITRNYARWVG